MGLGSLTNELIWYIMKGMWKKCLILLIFSLLAQLSWAAASTFCQHETGKSAQHFGHHAHQHESDDGDDYQNPSGNKKSITHPDCATCQHGSSMTSDVKISAFDMIFRQGISCSTSLPIPMPFLAEPERPKWLNIA